MENVKTSGPAFRVIVLGPQQAMVYEGIHVQFDPAHPVVHVLSADQQTHYLSVPVASAIVEWQDASALEPKPFVPSFGDGAFDQVGEQMQRMMNDMGRAFGQG